MLASMGRARVLSSNLVTTLVAAAFAAGAPLFLSAAEPVKPAATKPAATKPATSKPATSAPAPASSSKPAGAAPKKKPPVKKPAVKKPAPPPPPPPPPAVELIGQVVMPAGSFRG